MKFLKYLFILVWISKQFFAISDITNFLNTLPTERAIEAKIVVLNSQRSFLGSLSSPYILMYREDQK
jgi:hypothetical protein